MTLVLDENLSPRLVERLVTLFTGLKHVRDIGLQQAPDEEIWKWAEDNNCTVVSADADFVALSRRLGWPPKVIHIEKCDFPFRIIHVVRGARALKEARQVTNSSVRPNESQRISARSRLDLGYH